MTSLEKTGFLENKSLPPLVHRMLGLEGIGYPTTCGYQLLQELGHNEGVSHSVTHVFSLEGIGAAMFLDDGLVHMFFRSAFIHRTCAGLRHLENGKVTFANGGGNGNGVLGFAWGSSGGSSTRKQSFETSVRELVAERRQASPHSWSDEQVEAEIQRGMDLYSSGAVARQNMDQPSLGEWVWGNVEALPPLPAEANALDRPIRRRRLRRHVDMESLGRMFDA